MGPHPYRSRSCSVPGRFDTFVPAAVLLLLIASSSPNAAQVTDSDRLGMPLPSPSRWDPAISDVVALRRVDTLHRGRLPPRPASDLGHVVAVPADVFLVFDELVADRLLGIGGPRAKTWDAVDHVAYQVEAIEVVPDAHVERGAGGAFLLVAAHVKICVARSPVSQPVNEPRVAVKGENNGLVRSEESVEVVVRKTVWM